jgi:hypothetical protein
VNLGYCGLDRDRTPLRGDEIRPCWESMPQDGGEAVSLPIAPGPISRFDRGLFAEPDRGA